MTNKYKEKERIFLSLGSNLGNRRANLLSALELLREHCEIKTVSPVYETIPMYFAAQPKFYNLVAEVRTSLNPHELLDFVGTVERKLKRRRMRRNGPRTADVDILFYGSRVINSRHLTIPHPKLAERVFVLAPLSDISPAFIHPVLKLKTRALLALCPNKSEIRRLPANYEEALAWLYALPPSKSDSYGPAAVKNTLKKLGAPEKLIPSVHIAGSNGKTSVSMLLAKACRKAGFKTGLYISPHISDPRERITVDGEKISKADFFRLLQEVAGFDVSLSFFEFFTVIAFLYFARKKVQLAVIEAGLGGRLDATNVLNPEVAVITGISIEHSDLLGPDTKSIARHKAGIIKKGSVAVVSAAGQALKVIAERAAACGAPLHIVKKRQQEPFCEGSFQNDNYATAEAAVAALRSKGFQVPDKALAGAAKKFSPPGRFEEIKVSGRKVILDGAHNPAAFERLFIALKARYPNHRYLSLFGSMKDKDSSAMLAILEQHSSFSILTKPSSYRAQDPAALAAYLPSSAVKIILNPFRAFAALIKAAGPGDIAVVCGSFYLLADIKAAMKGLRASFPREMIKK